MSKNAKDDKTWSVADETCWRISLVVCMMTSPRGKNLLLVFTIQTNSKPKIINKRSMSSKNLVISSKEAPIKSEKWKKQKHPYGRFIFRFGKCLSLRLNW